MYKLDKELTKHDKAVAAVRFSPCGRFVASCSADRLIYITRVDSGMKMCVLDNKHRQGLNDIVWMQGYNGLYLAACSDDRTVVVWDVEKGVVLHTFNGHKGFVFCLASHSRNNALISGSYDGTVRLWDVRSRIACTVFDAHSEPVSSLDFRPESSRGNSNSNSSNSASSNSNCSAVNIDGDCAWTDQFVSSGSDGVVRTWCLQSQQCLRSHIMNRTPPLHISRAIWTPNGTHLVIGTLDSTIRLWDANAVHTARDVTGVGAPSPILRTYQQNPYTNIKYCTSICFTHSEHTLKNRSANRLAAGSESGHVILWNVHSSCIDESFMAHDDVVLALDTSPYVSDTDAAVRIVTGGATSDPSVKLWRLEKCD
jgi:COMPASS component SWD3